MPRIIFAVFLMFFCFSVKAVDMAFALTQSGGIVILTNTACKTSKPYLSDMKVFSIRYESKTELVNGCYVWIDNTITANFENGDVYEYQSENFQWTPDALMMLRRIEEKTR